MSYSDSDYDSALWRSDVDSDDGDDGVPLPLSVLPWCDGGGRRAIPVVSELDRFKPRNQRYGLDGWWLWVQ